MHLTLSLTDICYGYSVAARFCGKPKYNTFSFLFQVSKGEGPSLQQVRPALPATLHRPRGMHAASVTSDLSGERTALLAMARLADGRSPGEGLWAGVNSVYGGSRGRAVAGREGGCE